MQFATCLICRKTIPEQFVNWHHIKPRAAGGEDGNANLKPLCPTCHDTTHRVAEMLRGNKTGVAESLLTQLFPHPPVRRRLWDLAKIVYEEMLKSSEAVVEGKAHFVTVEFTPQEFSRLKALANDFVNKRGRPMGVANYLRNVTIGHLKTKGLA